VGDLSIVGMTSISPKALITIGVVAAAATLILVLVLVGMIPLLPSPPTPGTCGSVIECGMEFGMGNPVAGTCPLGGSLAKTGCFSGDFVYHLTIEYSGITFGEVLFHVASANGTVYVATGGEPGFSILNSTGAVAAHYRAHGGMMNMTSGWIYASGTGPSSSLGSDYTTLIDMGTIDPQSQGYFVFAVGTGAFSGTSDVSLP